jgi:lactoylglutathione lyase
VTPAGPAFPIIHTADLRAALAFWADGLGFAETFRVPPEGDATFVTLERGGSTIGLALVVPGTADERLGLPMLPAAGHPFQMCVYVHDVDATTAALAAAGAPVLRPPADEPWGERLAYVADPDGTPVMLVAPLS